MRCIAAWLIILKPGGWSRVILVQFRLGQTDQIYNENDESNDRDGPEDNSDPKGEDDDGDPETEKPTDDAAKG